MSLKQLSKTAMITSSLCLDQQLKYVTFTFFITRLQSFTVLCSISAPDSSVGRPLHGFAQVNGWISRSSFRDSINNVQNCDDLVHFQTVTLLDLKKELVIVILLNVLLSSFRCRSVEADRDEEMKRLKHSFERQVHRHCMVTILHLTRRRLSWGRRVG